MKFFDKLLESPAILHIADNEIAKRVRGSIIFFLIAGLSLFLIGIIRHSVVGSDTSRTITALYLIALFSLLFCYYISRTAKHVYPSQLMLTASLVVIALRALTTGGFDGMPIAWIIVIPVAATVILGTRWSLLWTVLSIINLIIIYLLEKFEFVKVTGNVSVEVDLISLIILTSLISTIVYSLDKDRSKTERKIIKNEKALAEANRMASVGTIAGGVGHEVNNPLTIIQIKNKMNLKLLERLESENKLNEEQKGILEKTKENTKGIDDNVQRISTITHSLLFITNDKSRKVFRSIVVSDLLDYVSKGLGNMADVELSFQENMANEYAYISADRTLMNRVLTSVIFNARDAALEVEDQWIRVRSKITKDKVIIKVIDSGRGIPESNVDKIFDPFFTTKDVGKGMGLGLSMCAKILEIHQGEIYLNRDAVNTEFVIEIPLVAKLNNKKNIHS